MATRKADQVWPGDGRAFMKQRDFIIGEGIAVKSLKPINLRCDIVTQCRPIERRAFGIPAKAFGIGQILGKMRSVNEHFFWHTAANDTGAANAVFLGHCNARAVPRRNARRPHAAGTSADNEQIIIVGHYTPARAISAAVDASKVTPPPSIALAISLPSSTPN